MSRGRTYPSETRRFIDEETGAEVVQLTDAPAIHHTLYFTNPSITADGRWTLFVSDRAGGWNLFGVAEGTGEIVQLTDGDDVNPFSAIPDRRRSRLYYTAGGQVRRLHLDTLSETVLADFGDARLGGCHLNAASSRLVTVVHRRDGSALATVDTEGLGYECFFEPPREVFYAQLCPADDRWVMYSSGIDQRIWVVGTNGLRDRPVYLHNREQWITHESWLGRTETILFTRWPDALMAIDRNGENLRTVAAMNAWHASSRWDGSLIVTDTTLPDIGLQLIDPETGRTATLCYPKASSRGTRWKERTPEADQITPETYGPQWTHPHPAFSVDGGWVTFTSDRTGHPQVYRVRIPETIRWSDAAVSD